MAGLTALTATLKVKLVPVTGLTALLVTTVEELALLTTTAATVAPEDDVKLPSPL
jgi:hypothetical protein